MTLKPGASDPANTTVWIILELGLFVGSWAASVITLSSMRVLWGGWPAWYENGNYIIDITRRGSQGDLWRGQPSLEKTQRDLSVTWLRRTDCHCRELGWQKRRMHGILLQRPLRIGTEMWPLRRTASAGVPTSSSGLINYSILTYFNVLFLYSFWIMNRW